MRVAVAIALTLCVARPALAEDIVVIGRLLENKPMAYVPHECPENHICLHSWWKSVVSVQKTVQGAKLVGHVAAAVMQHASLNPRFQKRVRLFVLRPIEDPAERAKLRVDYYLKAMSEPRQMYCWGQDPKASGLNVEEVYVSEADDRKTFCFNLPKG